ncbi:MAG: [citrate (pro-3S)-lyase] ligase [Peptococcaceae bacterium]
MLKVKGRDTDIIYESRIKDLNILNELFASFDLHDVTNTDYTVGIFEDKKLIGTGSLKGDILMGIAVDRAQQGCGISGRILSHLLKVAVERGIQTLYIFTRPEKEGAFSSFGFKPVINVPPYAAMLEWGNKPLATFQKRLSEIVFANCPRAAAIVINANPFTKGHQFLVEKAAGENDFVYVIVVEENISDFPFKVRFDLTQKGIAHLNNVKVLSGGKYVVSPFIFPSYFTPKDKLAETHASVDSELFAKYIAPVLNIKSRYAGTEPYNQEKNIYQEILKERLPEHGISVVEIERATIKDMPISASLVRKLIREDNFPEVAEYVPQTTYQFLLSGEAKPIIAKIQSNNET